jgi:hypothetical protein
MLIFFNTIWWVFVSLICFGFIIIFGTCTINKVVEERVLGIGRAGNLFILLSGI